MVNIVTTAVITIIISVISGLVLEYFKNLAPKILCTIVNGKPMKINNKKVYSYIITVSNLSNKIIHELALNIHSLDSTLQIADAKITKGLRFESSIKNNILDIDIPFLSKDDKFVTKIYVENQNGVLNEPIVVMRSPENFKEVHSIEQTGLLSSLFDISKNKTQTPLKNDEMTVLNKNNDFTMIMDKIPSNERSMNKKNKKSFSKNERISKNKRIALVVSSIIVIGLVGILIKSYLINNSANTSNPSAKTTVNKQSTDSTVPTKKTDKNSSSKTPTTEPKNSDTKASTSGTTKDSNPKTSTGETNVEPKQNSDAKTSAGETKQNTTTITQTEKPTPSPVQNISPGGTTPTPSSNTPSGQTSGTTVTKTPTVSPTPISTETTTK